MGQHFAVAQRLAGRAAQRDAGALQAEDFVNQSRTALFRGEHRIDPRVDPRVELGPRPIQDEHSASLGRAGLVELLLPAADRLAGLGPDFERAENAPRVVHVQPRGGDRIDFDQAAKQRAGPVALFVGRALRGEIPNRRAVP